MRIMRITVIIALVMLATGARAQMRFLPSEEFDHPYTDGPVTIYPMANQDEVRFHCNNAKFNLGVALGCARKIYKTCFIFKVSDEEIRAAGHNPGVFMRHEIGHCNG